MNYKKGDVLLEQYKVLFPLKDARNAETYRVLDKRGKLHFLKLFNPSELNPAQRTAEGELRELTIARLLNHPGTPVLSDSGNTTLNGEVAPYGIYEFVPGETMQALRRRELALDPSVVRGWMMQLLRTVSYLHDLPEVVCHNQIDLTNVMLDSRSGGPGAAVLIDYGHAHRHAITSDIEHEVQGHNPYFMAPECFEGDFSPASDVFALGAVYFNLVFGLPPWSLGMTAYQASRTDIRDELVAARSKPLSFLNVGAQLMPSEKELLVMRKALHPDKQHRFMNAAEMLAALSGEVDVQAKDIAPISRSTSTNAGMIGFDAIAGMEGLKQILSKEVLGPIRNPEKYLKYGLSIPNGMLLYGPPGCGKTFISERFAEEAGLEFRKIVPSDLASIYVHGSQEKIGKLFEEARSVAPCILFFDELDALLPNREAAGVNPGAAGEVNEFLAQMGNCSEAGVFIMGATNRPKLIDPAVLRTGRLDKKVYVAPPDFEARKAMFILHLSKRPLTEDVDYDELSHLSDGRVSSDLKFIVDEAARAALELDCEISQEILSNAINRSQPSVSIEEIKRYEQMHSELESDASTSSEPRPSIGFKFKNPPKQS